MEKIVEKGLLYDFYGELLTEHQKQIYEDAVYGDLSLGEIAEKFSISRQGVHDLLKRCDKQLAEYEAKLHLVEKFHSVKTDLERMQRICAETADTDELREELSKGLSDILEEL